MFNAKCLSVISCRSWTDELNSPSFDIIAWIHWRRAVWLGKALRGEKGEIVRTILHWNFQHRAPGDIFHSVPDEMLISFHLLTAHARNMSEWAEFCANRKPPGWVRHDNGRVNLRRSPRLTKRKSDEKSLQRQELRRQLTGKKSARWPAPVDVPPDELHVYTDGSAAAKHGLWKAGCGVWFSDGSNDNISTYVPGKQTVNRAELTAICLAVRKSMKKLSADRKLIVFSDSRICIDGINMWMRYWKQNAWTRDGRPLKNSDLWKVLDSAIADLKNAGFSAVFKHIPAHVGIYGNEKADRLAKAAMERAHKATPRTAEESQDRILEGYANDIVFACLQHT